MRTFHRERHRMQRIGWLRAAVLGANDGIVSTASLVLGVAAASLILKNRLFFLKTTLKGLNLTIRMYINW
jgi:VIT1/CCC1 family predicted Fe2+/Mn2+ transporter